VGVVGGRGPGFRARDESRRREHTGRKVRATLAACPIIGQDFSASWAGRDSTTLFLRSYGALAMIKQIKFVSIPVRDQNRALDFYTDKLGFTIIADKPFDGKQRWIELRIPKAQTRVVLFTTDADKKRIGTFMNLSFACDDVEKSYKEFKERGVEFDGPPKKQPWGTFAIFKDSEGNSFVLSTAN
jgi:predicted enzyme related to lactoylglutathione lyase